MRQALPTFRSKGSSFTGFTPGRLLDSRVGSSTVDGMFAGAGFQPSRSVMELTVGGRHGVAPGSSGVVLNVTAVSAREAGFLTVWPCGDPLPTASSLNFASGSTVANAVLSRLGADGKVCIYTSAATDLIVDVTGNLA